jgi:hypothetical protein
MHRLAMNRKNLLRFAPLTIVLVLAGCASSDGTEGGASDDAITPQEIAAGEAAGPTDDDAPESDGALAPAPDHTAVTTPAEDSTPFIDPEDALLPVQPVVPPGEIDPDDLNQTQSCHRVTGYRNGRSFNICVTTIDGRYVEVNTARAYLRMRKAARRSGVHLHVVSGFRSMAEQRYLYHCYKTRACNGGNLAAVPGYSNHQSGHALDLNTSAGGVYSWLANHGHAYGFRRTVPTEKWHWEH